MAGFLLAGLATEAQAATVTYNFAGSFTGYSPTMNFTAALGPNLTVSANIISDDLLTVTPITSAGAGTGIGRWSGGLGIQNTTNDNSHTVDGYGLNDLLVLTFASTVKLISATFGYAGVEPNSYDDFAFFADDSDPGTSLVGDMIFLSEEMTGSGGTGSYNFTTGTVGTGLYAGSYIGTVFGIGAIYDFCTETYRGNCKTTSFDSFKLKSVTVETVPGGTIPEVPLPAGVILLFSALASLGLLDRPKSKSSSASA